MSNRGFIHWIGRVVMMQTMRQRMTTESRSDRAHSARYMGFRHGWQSIPPWTTRRVLSGLPFQLFKKHFPRFRDFRCNHELAIEPRTIALKVLLVGVLRPIKSLEGRDFRHNRRIPDPGCGYLSNSFLGNLFLVLTMVENDRAILRADVCSLTIQRRGVMDSKEHLQEFFEGNGVWVEGELDHLCMSTVTLADLVVRRIRHSPAC